MSKLFNRAKMTTATTGTGNLTLGSAASGFVTFATAGVVNGDVVRYCIEAENGTDFEIGEGTYTASGTVLSRADADVQLSSNSNNRITLATGTHNVFITAADSDFTQEIIVTVANSGAGNKYVIDGTSQQIITLLPSITYRLDQSDSTNAGHPLVLASGSADGSTYSTGVRVVGTPGSKGSYTEVKLEQDAPALWFKCSNHAGMGNSINLAAPVSVTTEFTGLTDTPSSLSGQGGKAVQVNSGGSALEFVDAGGAGTTVHANQTAMTNSNPDAGTLHFVTDTNSLFVKNSSGFFRLAQLTNVNPTISNLQHTTNGTTETIAASATFGLTTGQNSVITLTATDPDFGDTIFYSASVVSGTEATVAASITQGTGANVNQFTIVPASSGSGLSSITIRFDASDGIGVAQRSASFSIAFYNYSNTAQQSQLNASDGAANDFLGGASAIDGDYCVVGAYGDENYKGAAYVYVRSGTSWTQQAKLTADDGGAGHYFGYSVSISGNTIVVGAYAGHRAYVFTRSGTSWSQQQKITPANVQSDNFGYSVGIDGEYIVVGAKSRHTHGYSDNKGYALVFVRSGTSWSQQGEFTGDSTSSGDVFGWSVGISGDTVAVGAKFDDDGGTNVGQVFVFTRSGTSWSQQAKFYHSSAVAADLLGASISIHGNTIAAGAWGEDTSGSTSGAVYVFVRNGTSWSQQAKLKASNAGATDNLGYSVSVKDDLIIAGAPYEDTTASDAGSAYIFERSGTSWTQTKQIQASNASSNDRFGWSVGFSEPYFVVGAHFEDTSGSNAGAGYVFVAG